ncbi:hypothetical protein FACS189454_00070 [Planctomycetales bacterium]|nr:hypothetical protein FACS189443_2210 [Planctomycetales bacterium]GHT43932.1 hypothetical protein FACS189454_00070 [Planctomycetales bacterium]
MKKMIVFTLAALACCANCFVQAQEPKEGEGTELKLNKVNYVSAASIPFKKELGVAFPGLLTIGTRIELAAKDSDPVGLIAAGLELKAAETAAGKTAANYKADDVIKRGFNAAILRSDVTELKGVKALLPDKAEAIDKAIKAAEASKGEEPRGNVVVTVVNHHGECLNVFFDEQLVGHVEAYRKQTFRKHTHHPICVEVRCESDGSIEWERHDVINGYWTAHIH